MLTRVHECRLIPLDMTSSSPRPLFVTTTAAPEFQHFHTNLAEVAFAATQAEARRTQGKHRVMIGARFFTGVPIAFFGVEHFLHPEFAPGVPLTKLAPSWIPAPLFWSYPTGAVFAAAGLSLLVNKEAHLAATWLGLMILLLAFVDYVPVVVAKPSDIGSGLNSLVDTLLLSGSALAFAGAQRGELANKMQV